MSRPVVRLAVGIIITIVLLAGAGGAFIWWKISGLKEQLVHNLESSLGAKADVTSLDFDVWKGELHAAGITLTNQRPTAPWETGAISQATVSFHLSDVFSTSIPLRVEVSSWNLSINPSRVETTSPITPPTETLPGSNAPVSESLTSIQHIHVTQLSAHDGSVEIDLSGDKKVLIHGVSFEASNNGANVWTTQLQASSLEAGTLAAGVSSVQIQGTRDKVTFTNLRMQCDQGFLTGDGNLALTDHHASTLDLKATDIPVSMLVSVAWQMKLTGFASGDLHYEGDDQGGSAKGQFALNHGKFNVLPWLGKVTLLVGLQDITDVEVDQATTDFSWKDRTLHLTNLDIRKNDTVRIAGAADINPQGQVDGKLKLGLPSTVTAKWPQLQEKVFSVPLEDFNWTEVHLTGTPDHLQEDLTPRLLAVGEGQGTDIIDQTKQKAHLAFRAALDHRVAATACLYATDLHTATLGQGKKDDTLARVRESRAEMLLIWGRQDPHVPLAGRKLIHDALTSAETSFQWHEFNGAHAFARDEGPRYDAATSRLAFELTLELFHRRLTYPRATA